MPYTISSSYDICQKVDTFLHSCGKVTLGYWFECQKKCSDGRKKCFCYSTCCHDRSHGVPKTVILHKQPLNSTIVFWIYIFLFIFRGEVFVPLGRWTGLGGPSGIPFAGERTGYRRVPSPTSGRRMSRQSGRARALSPSNIWDVWRCSIQGECRCARRRLKFWGWVVRHSSTSTNSSFIISVLIVL